MKIAHVGDLHVDSRSGEHGHSLDSQEEILKWIGNDAESHGARLMLVAGDVFDRKTEACERNLISRIMFKWSTCFPVVIVRGNHDGEGELEYIQQMRSISNIFAVSAVETVHFQGGVIACLPWPSKAAVVADAGSESCIETRAQAQAALRTIFDGWRSDRENSQLPLIVLGHVDVGGAAMDSGQPVSAASELSVSAHDLLDIGADYYALGHIHKHQILHERICYAGSIRQTDFGEDTVKGYCLVDVERGHAPVIEHHRAPGRKLYTIEAGWATNQGQLETDNGVRAVDEAIIPGHSYRLQYTVSSDIREQARAQAETAKQRWLKAGAASVKIDAKTTQMFRTRSEAIQTAKTPADKLEAYWKSIGYEPTDCIREMARALESEVGNED